MTRLHVQPRRTTPGIYDVEEYGAIGDGVHVSTEALQGAIDACGTSGGGTVRVPAGTFVTGALWLRNYVTLELMAGATLRATEQIQDFPPYQSEWEGPNVTPMHAGLINGQGLRDVAVIGRGTIDGSGGVWWALLEREALTAQRPRLIRLVACNNVLIDGLTCVNSPMWTINPLACDNVTVTRLTIRNPDNSPNTDGINPECSSNVRISDCHIDVGDDCISLKASTEDDRRQHHRACENVTVTNCTMLRGHGGVVIGSEITGGVRNVVISDCIFNGTDRGIRIKARRGRGYAVEDVRVANVLMDGVLCPIVMNLFYGPGATSADLVTDTGARPVTDATPAFRRIGFFNIHAKRVRAAAAYILGLPERAIEDVKIEGMSVVMDCDNSLPEAPAMSPITQPMCRTGMHFQHVRGLRLNGIDVHGSVGPALTMHDVHRARITNMTTDDRCAESSVWRCSDVVSDGSANLPAGSKQLCRGSLPS